MISLSDVYHIVAAVIPLYVAMILAYASVKWWKLFTPDQCSGINKFVSKFSIPLLSFQVIAGTNPYKMNPRLIASDVLQKFFAIFLLGVFAKFSSRGGIKWVITGFSLSTLPNTLLIGIPLVRAMYGDEAGSLLAQIIVLQSAIWYNILLFLFELNAAKAASETSPMTEDTTGGLDASQEGRLKEEEDDSESRPARKSRTVHILLTVGKKLIKNPNTHATILGLIWACVHFRWDINLPEVVDKSISILEVGGLGMAMFSIGLFMALRPSIIACGIRLTILAMGMRFILGPALMALSSVAVGLRGTLLRIAIVQAALPQGIVTFVFAKEYNIHPEIMSTSIVFGIIIAMPVALTYYFLLAL